MAKNLETTKKIIAEIIDTEKKYLDSLNYFMNEVLKKIQIQFGNKTPELINSQTQELEAIIHLNTNFFKTLQTASQNENNLSEIAKLFIQNAEPFKRYATYMKNIPDFSNYANSNDIKTFCENLKSPQTFGAYAIMPAQRIPRYKLLLEALKKEISEPESNKTDVNAINEAIEKISATALFNNQAVKEFEDEQNKQKPAYALAIKKGLTPTQALQYLSGSLKSALAGSSINIIDTKNLNSDQKHILKNQISEIIDIIVNDSKASNYLIKREVLTPANLDLLKKYQKDFLSNREGPDLQAMMISLYDLQKKKLEKIIKNIKKSEEAPFSGLFKDFSKRYPVLIQKLNDFEQNITNIKEGKPIISINPSPIRIQKTPVPIKNTLIEITPVQNPSIPPKSIQEQIAAYQSYYKTRPDRTCAINSTKSSLDIKILDVNNKKEIGQYFVEATAKTEKADTQPSLGVKAPVGISDELIEKICEDVAKAAIRNQTYPVFDLSNAASEHLKTIMFNAFQNILNNADKTKGEPFTITGWNKDQPRMQPSA